MIDIFSISGDDLLVKLETKINRINQDLVKNRTLETQVKAIKGITDDLNNNLDDLDKFATGDADCSFEKVQNFLTKYGEYPEIGMEETQQVTLVNSATSNNAQTFWNRELSNHFGQSSCAKNNWKSWTIERKWCNLKNTVNDFYKIFWSWPFYFGSSVCKVGLSKTYSKTLANFPILNFHFQSSNQVCPTNPEIMKVGVLNPVTLKPHFERRVNGSTQESIVYSVGWALLFSPDLNWLDNQGNLIIYFKDC